MRTSPAAQTIPGFRRSSYISVSQSCFLWLACEKWRNLFLWSLWEPKWFVFIFSYRNNEWMKLINFGVKKKQKHLWSCLLETWFSLYFFQNYRCRNLADPVVRSVRALVICQFCKLSRAVYNPCNFFFNQNMCVVCGNMVHGVPQQRAQAHLCHFHSCSYAPNMTKCFLCDKVTLPNQTVPAKLCHHCSFGVFGKSCALLDLRWL